MFKRTIKILATKSCFKFFKNLFVCHKPVYLDTDVDRRPNNDEQIADRSDLTERLDKLTDLKFFLK